MSEFIRNAGPLALLIVLVFALIAFASRASAQTLTLQLSSSSLTFQAANPPSMTDISASENPVSATVTYTGTGAVHIFMIASGDLTPDNGGPTIPASNVYWTAGGTGYESGTMSATQQVEASSGTLSTGSSDGWRFYLKHALYESGAYQISITVMATAQ